MRRLTARFLLVLLLVGIFVPAALAIAAPVPHACCIRKPIDRHIPHDARFAAPDCCSHNCCSPVTVAQWAQPAPSRHIAAAAQYSGLLQQPQPHCLAIDFHHAPSGRAPPATSIA